MRLQIERSMAPEDVAEVQRLLAAAERADGQRPLSDHLWLDLVHGGRPGFAGVIGRPTDGEDLIGYAQVSRSNASSVVELVVHPDRRAGERDVRAALLRAALDVVAADGGGHVHWWAFDATADHDRLAGEVGLVANRELHQMRRPLPTGEPLTVDTRAFRVGEDEAAWLAVNNRAFAGHDEQGGWDLETIRWREAEPWFDPDGLRLHERDGRLAAFCWTKVHRDSEPVLGEIYVIAVDPDFHGLGLGRALTLAGLDSLARRDVGTGMLYVDSANTTAVGLYERLGFVIHRTDRAYATEIRTGETTG